MGESIRSTLGQCTKIRSPIGGVGTSGHVDLSKFRSLIGGVGPSGHVDR